MVQAMAMAIPGADYTATAEQQDMDIPNQSVTVLEQDNIPITTVVHLGEEKTPDSRQPG